jgi:malonyl CoA-acyl carrier protein transacylase/NRPS condensation-like uncharacterized protein/acyl carrier protein
MEKKVQDIYDALATSGVRNSQRVFSGKSEVEERAIVFMFPGQGTQYVNMGRELYLSEPLFRAQVDNCSEYLHSYLGFDLRTILYPDNEQMKMAMEQINQAIIAQPTIFVIEYALAQLLMSWGITPQAMIGHSIGEYVAACLADVISLEDTLQFIALRSQLIQQQPPGAMLAVPLSEQEIQPFLVEGISLAAVNSPMYCVVSGPLDAIEKIEKCMTKRGLALHTLRTSHAFHSMMMLPVVTSLTAPMELIQLHPPRIPFISNVGGTWITAEEATNPEHWRTELLQTVRFADGLHALLQKHHGGILLEVGAGRTLSTLCRQQISAQHNPTILTSLRHPHDHSSDCAFLLNTLAQLWVAGANVNWLAYSHELGQHITPPTTPFDKQSDMVEAQEIRQLCQREHTAAEHLPTGGNEIEQRIAGIWLDLLGIGYIGRHENFFKLGGDSLLAGQLFTRLRQIFQVELPLTTIFDHPTIAELTELVTQSKASTGAGQIYVFQDRDHQLLKMSSNKIFPLSSAQQRLWFLDQLQGSLPVYHIAVAYRIKGELDLVALKRALNEIVRRHEILRTTFPMIDGQPVQSVAPKLIIKLVRESLETLPDGQREIEIQHQAIKEMQRPFHLAEGPLLRVKLLRLSRHEYVLLLTIHHIVSDGWSMGILYREMTQLYEAYVRDEPSPLLELPIQYAEYSAWEKKSLKGEVMETELTYWKQQLADAPPALELPTDHPRSPVETFRGRYEVFMLPSSLIDEMKDLSQREGVTLFMILLAAFQILLARYSRQDDIVVGTDIANRNQVEVEDLIGFFVNQLVLRTNLSGNPSLSELLQRIRKVVLGAYEHHQVPFDQLVREINPIRFPNRAPLFQVKLVLQNLPVPSKHSIITIDPLLIDPGVAQLDLLLALTETASGLQGVWQYNTDLFEVSTIEKMSHHFSLLLKYFVAYPSHTILAFNTMLDEEEINERDLRIKQLAQSRHHRLKRALSKPVTTSILHDNAQGTGRT